MKEVRAPCDSIGVVALLAHGELIAIAREHHSTGRRIHNAHVDIERRANASRGEISEQVLSSGTASVGCDRLRCSAFAERKPCGARAIVIDGGVYRALKIVRRIGREVANPRVEVNDEASVVWLTELHEPEPIATENDLVVEMRCLRTPGCRALDQGRSAGTRRVWYRAGRQYYRSADCREGKCVAHVASRVGIERRGCAILRQRIGHDRRPTVIHPSPKRK